jgi:1-acyl-sn-glycerol-3-phosphate acyltransferase
MRVLLTLAFYVVATPLAALFYFPYTLLTRNPEPIYHAGAWIAWFGMRLAGIRVRVVGRDRLDPNGTYIFMMNHVSNVDPPILLYWLPRRTSVLVKKELFRIPVLGPAMRLAMLVPVDRSDRANAIASLKAAEQVLRAGVNMSIFVEGTRSRDGRLLPFKKGPFFLAMDSGVPIVPITFVGAYEAMPKGKLTIRPGVVTLVFHSPIDHRQFTDRDALIAAVRDSIASALPRHQQDPAASS